MVGGVVYGPLVLTEQGEERKLGVKVGSGS